MRLRALAASAAVALSVGSPAVAQATLPVDVSIGIDFTTDYVFRGATQTANSPAAQPFVELGLNGFYVGAWGSNVRFSGSNEFEYDVLGGYRNEVGAFSYDVGYVRYLYTDSGDCCGDAYLLLNWQATEALGLGTEIWQDFENDVTYTVAGIGYALPFAELEASGGVGYNFDSETANWNVGVSRALTEAVGIDLRYHQADGDDALFVATLSFATGWAAGGEEGAGVTRTRSPTGATRMVPAPARTEPEAN